MSMCVQKSHLGKNNTLTYFSPRVGFVDIWSSCLDYLNHIFVNIANKTNRLRKLICFFVVPKLASVFVYTKICIKTFIPSIFLNDNSLKPAGLCT